jgi:predicted transcriptional regulator
LPTADIYSSEWLGNDETSLSVRRNRETSIRTQAKALKRDYSNVHADVQALTGAGLLETAPGSLKADYEAIVTKIAI